MLGSPPGAIATSGSPGGGFGWEAFAQLQLEHQLQLYLSQLDLAMVIHVLVTSVAQY